MPSWAKTTLHSHDGYCKSMRGHWEYWGWKRQNAKSRALQQIPTMHVIPCLWVLGPQGSSLHQDFTFAHMMKSRDSNTEADVSKSLAILVSIPGFISYHLRRTSSPFPELLVTTPSCVQRLRASKCCIWGSGSQNQVFQSGYLEKLKPWSSAIC